MFVRPLFLTTLANALIGGHDLTQRDRAAMHTEQCLQISMIRHHSDSDKVHAARQEFMSDELLHVSSQMVEAGPKDHL
jgi:hypothetical protein